MVTFAAVAVAVAALTWGSIPWSWGFAAFYVALAFILRLAERLPQLHVGTSVQTAILAFSAPFVLHWFFGDRWAEAALHVGSIAVLCMLLGFAIGERILSANRAV